MTRKLFSVLLPLALLTASAFAQNGSAAAPQVSPTKIGIINIQEAIVGSNEGQRDFGALQKKFEPTQNELNALNKEIDGLKAQLQAQGDKMNDDAKNNLVKNIEGKQKILQRRAEDAQSDFQTQQNEIANRIGGKILELLDKYAKQNGYAVIVDVSSQQSPVLWAANNNIITKDIVEAYNTQSGVPAPAAPAASAPVPSAPRPQATRPATSAPPKTTPK